MLLHLFINTIEVKKKKKTRITLAELVVYVEISISQGLIHMGPCLGLFLHETQFSRVREI